MVETRSSSAQTCSAHGIYRRKHTLRAIFRAATLLVLVSGYALFNGFYGDEGQGMSSRLGSQRTGLTLSEPANNSEVIDIINQSTTRQLQETATECPILETVSTTAAVALFIGILYMFLSLAIVCDEFFVPALEEIASPHHMDLSKDVAGATLMAAGGSSPELFTNFVATFQQSDIGIGTILGSAVFNVLFVIGVCSMLSKEVLHLTWWPLVRDCVYYACGLGVLASVLVGVSNAGEVTWWEALMLLVMYVGYVIFMKYNRRLYKMLTRKEFVSRSGTASDDSEENILPAAVKNGSSMTENSSTEPNEDDLTASLLNARDPSEAAMYTRHQQEYSLEHQKQQHVCSNQLLESDSQMEEKVNGICAALYPPKGQGIFAWLSYFFTLPIMVCLVCTIPDVRRPGLEKWCYLSFTLSIVWIGSFSYLMVGWTELLGNTIGIPSVVMGLTLLAAGNSAPDCISAVIVARAGEGNMAISSSIGSNIFDILLGLPLPWLCFTIYQYPNVVVINSEGLWVSVFILIGMLFAIVIIIHCHGYKMTKTLGGCMFALYFMYMAQAIRMEYLSNPCFGV